MTSESQLDQLLIARSKELDAEIRTTEENIRSLQGRLAHLQKQKAAVGCLVDTEPVPEAGDGNPHSASPEERLLKQIFETTPYTEFDRPLLESLVELGGKSSSDEVLQRMKSKMGPTLKPGDFDTVSTGEERWRNTARWRRNALVKLGFLRTDSPRGIWGITEAGKAWLRRS